MFYSEEKEEGVKKPGDPGLIENYLTVQESELGGVQVQNRTIKERLGPKSHSE